MKPPVIFLLTFITSALMNAQNISRPEPSPGFESRLEKYIDSLRVIDNHEHLFDPAIIEGSSFKDFMLLFQQNGYDDLVSAGMPDSLFDGLYNGSNTPVQKWKIIEPYWKNSFNTSFSRIILKGVKRLYNIDDLNESTVTRLSNKIKNGYNTSWMDRILKDSCHIDFIIQDGYIIPGKDSYIRYAKRYEDWLTVRSKFRIDSIAIRQLDPIFTLEDFVKSLQLEFEKGVRQGMTVVKIFTSYSRTLNFEKVEPDVAKKVFRNLVNSSEDHVISLKDAKPLQDYMFYRLMDLAKEYNVPVAIHTGLQAGTDNFINNSDPTLLCSVFKAYPEIKFILYHGSYPYGGLLSALAKNYPNVYIDMNWTYSISPTYIERYLNEWIETVPASKLIAFGGDAMVVENVYSELVTAKRIITSVLSGKVRDGYFTEEEARKVARMILHDNAAGLYKLN
jgi:hypothetical protein